MRRTKYWFGILTILILAFSLATTYLYFENQLLEQRIDQVQDGKQDWRDTAIQSQETVNELNSTINQLQANLSERQSELEELEKQVEAPEDFKPLMIEREIHRIINEERRQRDIDRVVYSPDLRETAESKNQDMFNYDYFAHENPETGRSLSDIMNEFSVPCGRFGENLAMSGYGIPVEDRKTGEVTEIETNAGAAADIMEGLMNSDGHRENILDPEWESVGVAVTKSEDKTVKVTQHFCSTIP